jgi:pSer/pThr/pTyr-binding forkhead associated (FHA) protein
MTPPAFLRIGSLEILGALALFGVIAAKVRAEPPVPPRPATLDLVVHEPPARGGRREQRVLLAPRSTAVIGRSSDAAVGVLDPEVSRTHAALSLTDGVVYLADLGSRNGTFLNGKRVQRDGIEVLAGDAIDVGTTRITVSEIQPA